MKKIKVLFLIESFIVGGAEKVLIDIVNNLNPQKYDITLCSIFKYSVYPHYDKTFSNVLNNNIKYRYLINNRFSLLYYSFNFLINRIPSFIYRLCFGNKYDKVIAFYEGLPTYFIAKSPISKKKKIAWLHTETKLSMRGKNKAELLHTSIIYSKYENIIAISQSVANSFRQTFPNLTSSNISTIYNPIDYNKIKRLSDELNPIKNNINPIFVTIGRITEAKGYDRWLNVVSRLKKDGYLFKSFIIGGGDTTHLNKKITTLGINSHVELLGHKNNPYPYIKYADWIICTSIIEGLPLVLLESIALNKAIISTDFNTAKEIIGHKDLGLIVPNNEIGLYDGIVKILSHPEIKQFYEKKTSSYPFSFNIETAILQIEKILQ